MVVVLFFIVLAVTHDFGHEIPACDAGFVATDHVHDIVDKTVVFTDHLCV